jgi:excinuclease UvrABC nuclease subunit
MTINELSPQPAEKVVFKLSFFKIVPKLPGCYILTTFSNYILYVGLSNNLNLRFQQHLENPKKTNLTKFGKAVWFYYLQIDVNNLPKLERTWINQYVSNNGELPILNRINSPVG